MVPVLTGYDTVQFLPFKFLNWDQVSDNLGVVYMLVVMKDFILHCFEQALKAVVLERMGKGEEALSACLEAKELLHSDTGPFLDDLTLSTLQIVLQRLDRCMGLYHYAFFFIDFFFLIEKMMHHLLSYGLMVEFYNSGSCHLLLRECM